MVESDSGLIAIWITFFVVVVVWAGCFTLFWRNRKRCSFSGSQEDDLERLTQEQRSNRRRRARRVRYNFSRLEATELYRRMGDPPPSYEDSILASTAATAGTAVAMSQSQAADGTQQPPDYTPVSIIDITASNAENVCGPSSSPGGREDVAIGPLADPNNANYTSSAAVLDVSETSTLAARIFQRADNTLASIHRPRPIGRAVLPPPPPPYQRSISDPNNNV